MSLKIPLSVFDIVLCLDQDKTHALKYLLLWLIRKKKTATEIKLTCNTLLLWFVSAMNSGKLQKLWVLLAAYFPIPRKINIILKALQK